MERDQYGGLVFQAPQNGIEKIVFIRPDGYDAFNFENDANRIIPLANSALLISRKYPQPKPTETFVTETTELADNIYFEISSADGSVQSLEADYPQIGNKIAEASAGNTFLFMEPTDNSTNKGTVKNGQIEIEKFTEITPGIPSYWRLNESTALVCTITNSGNEGWSDLHFYLVQMGSST